MTIKEITALRKSGQLQDALTAAESEFTQNSNIYTAGALFWCLNELLKQQSEDEIITTVKRMKSLYDDFCDGDEIMQKILASINLRISPHYQEVKDALEKAKNSVNTLSDFRKISSWYKEGTLEVQLYHDFGWLIYHTLKHIAVEDAQTRKILLHQYLQLNLPKPAVLHSLILNEAVKVEQNTPYQFRIRDFIRLWGLENLRVEDWEQFTTKDGNIMPSLVEKLIGVYAKELKTDKVEASEEFSQLVDKAIIKYPKNQYMTYFKATVLISQGRIQDALKYYKGLILKYPSKFYLWHHTAELIDNVDIKIGLLSKALKCGADDEYLGGVHLSLASLLCQKGLQENAKFELEKYRDTYKNKGWKLKPEFWQIYNSLASIIPVKHNDAIYSEYSVNADEFIYSSLPTDIAIKMSESLLDDRNHPGRKILIWTLLHDDKVVRLRKPTKFGLNKHTQNGTIFDIKLLDNRVVWIVPHEGSVSLSWLKEISGVVQLRKDRNGNNYAIISDTYVGEKLLKGIANGQTIRVISLQRKDGRWSAISILK